MRKIRRGPPRELVLSLRDEFSIPTFIETGAYEGKTTRWASKHFSRVVSIELSEQYYHRTLEQLDSHKNVDLINDNSAMVLPELGSQLDSDAIFWLDAHYMGGDSAGKADECPLMAELDALHVTNHKPYVFIDDARFFLSPPPRPWSYTDWPTISEVLTKLQTTLGENYYIVVTEDVIVAVPPTAEETVRSYARDVATENWNESNLSEGLRLMYTGTLDKLASDRTVQLLERFGLYPVARKIYHALD